MDFTSLWNEEFVEQKSNIRKIFISKLEKNMKFFLFRFTNENPTIL